MDSAFRRIRDIRLALAGLLVLSMAANLALTVGFAGRETVTVLVPAAGGWTVTAAMAAAGWSFAVHENRQKLSNFPLVRASNARRCSSVMLVVSGMTSISATVAQGEPSPAPGSRPATAGHGLLPAGCTAVAVEGRTAAIRGRGGNRVPCPRGMGIGAVTR